MNVRQLHYFLQVAELRSFTRAAAILHIAQPALSRSVRALEDELGVTLFHRSERGVTLTESGELLKRRAADLLADFTKVRDEVAAGATTLRGELSFGMPPSMQEMVTLPLIEAFRAAHPLVLLRFTEGISVTLNEGLQAGKIDVAIVAANEPLAAPHQTPLVTEGMFLVGPTNARLSLRRPVSLERVASEPLIVTLRPNSLRALLETALTRAGQRFEPVMEANATALMIAAVARGGGYTVLPYCAIGRALREKRVSAAPVANLRVMWALAYAQNRIKSRAVAELSRLAQAVAEHAVGANTWKSAEMA